MMGKRDIGFSAKRPQMKCYIYTRNEGYTEYNKNTRPDAVLLEGVTVKLPKKEKE